MLTSLESTCEAVATNWTMQSDNFQSQGATMAKNHVTMMRTMKSVVGRKNVLFWTNAMESLKTFAMEMNKINNSFNLKTAATPPRTQIFNLPTIDLTVRVPSTLKL